MLTSERGATLPARGSWPLGVLCCSGSALMGRVPSHCPALPGGECPAGTLPAGHRQDPSMVQCHWDALRSQDSSGQGGTGGCWALRDGFSPRGCRCHVLVGNLALGLTHGC